MRLEGSLDAFGLPDVLHLLTSTGKTGALRLQRGSTTAVARVRAGMLSGVRADLGREDLGRRLVGSGAVAEAALREAIGAATSTGTGLGPALRDVGAVDEAVLAEVAAAVTVDALAELLRWPDGHFSFLADEPDPDDVGLALDAAEVLAEGARRLAEWPALLRVVPTPDAVARLSVTVPEGASAAADDWALLALVDGRRSVRDLVGLTGRGEYAVTAQVVALVHRGLLSVRREALDTDPAADLARRQALLAPLEQPAADAVPSAAPQAAVVPAPSPASTAVPAAPAATVRQSPAPPPAALQPAALQPAALQPAAPQRPSPLHAAPRPAPTAPPVAAPPSAVPTPVGGLPPAVPAARTPYPGAVGAGSTGTLGSAAVAYQPSPVPASPDPAVTRSLLLRLIAGVQSL